MKFKFSSSLLILVPAAQSTLFSGQFGGGYYPENFYGGGGGLYGGYPGYFDGFGFNPTFFASNNDFNANNFRANQFDRKTNAAVFNDNIHKKAVDANSINTNGNNKLFSA